MASATVQAADYTVSDELLSDVQGYIDTAGNDALKSRWTAAYATLTGNIYWKEGTSEQVFNAELGITDTVQVDGYWAVKGTDARAITLNGASVMADLHKAKRWNPVKKAIRKLLKNDMYGVARVAPEHTTLGWWNTASPLKAQYEALRTPDSYVTSGERNGYNASTEAPPVRADEAYSFSAWLDNHVRNPKDDKSFVNPQLTIAYDSAKWDAAVKWAKNDGNGFNDNGVIRVSRGGNRYDPTISRTTWDNLSFEGGKTTNVGLEAQLWQSTSSTQSRHGQSVSREYFAVGTVVTENLAATFKTDTDYIPDRD